MNDKEILKLLIDNYLLTSNPQKKEALTKLQKKSVKCTCGFNIGHPLVKECSCKPETLWEILTDDEIQYLKSIYASYTLYDEGEYGTEVELDVENFARAIELTLMIKNT